MSARERRLAAARRSPEDHRRDRSRARSPRAAACPARAGAACPTNSSSDARTHARRERLRAAGGANNERSPVRLPSGRAARAPARTRMLTSPADHARARSTARSPATNASCGRQRASPEIRARGSTPPRTASLPPRVASPIASSAGARPVSTRRRSCDSPSASRREHRSCTPRASRQEETRDREALGKLVQQHRHEDERAERCAHVKGRSRSATPSTNVCSSSPTSADTLTSSVTSCVSSPKWKCGASVCCVRCTSR